MNAQSLARAAWEQRYAIETEAAVRFKALTHRLRTAGAPNELAGFADQAAKDETRHAAHCQTFVTQYGGSKLEPVERLLEYAPRELSQANRLLYEIVAQACVAETQSMATLVTLLEEAETSDLRSVLRELARDEVRHAQLGWGYLGWAKERGDIQFLGSLLPLMIEGSAGPELFAPGSASEESFELLRYGVMPRHMRRHVYVETLEAVIFPGFEHHGVDTGEARRWLKSKGSG